MTSSALLRPLLLGVVTGLRSQLGPAALAWSQPARSGDPAMLRKLRSPAGRASAILAVAGELVADKLPQTPSRLRPPVLGARLATGAVVGALAADSAAWRSRGTGAVLGTVGAAAGSYAGAAYRKAAVARTSLPDLPFAVVEDAVAVGLAATAVTAWPRRRPRWTRPFTSR